MPGILIVDDNSSIRYLLRVFVESKTAFTVCGEAGHGVEAIEKAKQLQPDLVLLDLSMPVLTGAEAASIIKRTMPQVKIILFSMRADGGVSKSLASALGVDLALSKSDSLLQLAEHINELLIPEPKTFKADA
jgi:two-component system nitrate/nitrite response regulator NarL